MLPSHITLVQTAGQWKNETVRICIGINWYVVYWHFKVTWVKKKSNWGICFLTDLMNKYFSFTYYEAGSHFRNELQLFSLVYTL